MEKERIEESIIECTIKRLLESGTVTYETSGWGTGEILIKCKSNTKCGSELLNKNLIALKASECEVSRENVEEYLVKALEKKIAYNDSCAGDGRKYNSVKRKFKAWKSTYKNEYRLEW